MSNTRSLDQEGQRAFLALDPGPRLALQLAEVLAALRRLDERRAVRWVPAENLHLTLHFFAQLPDAKTEPLLEALEEALRSLDPLTLPSAAIRFFPPKKRARIIALDFQDSAGLLQLWQCVEGAVRAAGLPQEERSFRPHLTLGRLRAGRGGLREEVLRGSQPRRLAPLEATQLVLYGSELRAEGPRYTALRRIDLGNAPRNP